MKIKRNKIDDIFSKCIRERDGWACQVCGKQYPRGSQGLHASHIYSRRHQNTRYDPLNVWSKCFSCHSRLQGDPIEFAAWARKFLGDVLYEELREKHNTIRKWTKAEKEELYRHYKLEWKRLLDLRACGREGPLGLHAYD